MEAPLIHYEVFVRKNPTSRWVLELATDQPHIALSTAEDLVKSARVAAAMVTKETFNDAARVFESETLFKQAVEGATRKAAVQDWDPLCASPADLYADRARERIAGLVASWLARNRVTTFELLHNAELVEKLEAASTEMQHAIQKFAVAEVQIRGGVTHEIIRRVHSLLDQASARLRRDHVAGTIAKATPEAYAAMAEALAGKPDAPYLLGGAVAAASSACAEWPEKVACLLDLMEAAPADGPARALALAVVDQPLAEMLVSDSALQALVGDCDDLGGVLAALTRLIAPEAVERAIVADPRVARVMPLLSPEAARLAERLAAGELRRARAAAAKRVLGDLQGQKRLRPADATQEILVLRGLAMSLTAATGALLPEEDVLQALGSRSRTLLSSDFLDAYLGQGRQAKEEADALLFLAQNVVGAANKRRAGRLLQGAVFGLKFETEMTSGTQTPAGQLAGLAALQRAVAQGGLAREDLTAIERKLGQLGGRVEAEANLVAALLKAKASPVQKLSILLRLASGDAAPLGPVADYARAEAMKLVRDDNLRAELAQDEAQMTAVRELIQQAGLAA